MNNQREIYEALLAGETLDNGGFTVQLGFNGTLLDDEDDKINLTFSDPSRWKIYKKPKWYENIPDGGVLCWCWDSKESCKVVAPVLRQDEYGFKIDSDDHFQFSSPLTKQEIQVFLSNVPEDL